MSCEGIMVEVYDGTGKLALKERLVRFGTEANGRCFLVIAEPRGSILPAPIGPSCIDRAVVYFLSYEETVMVQAKDFGFNRVDFGTDIIEYTYGFTPEAVYDYKKEKEGWGCFRGISQEILRTLEGRR